MFDALVPAEMSGGSRAPRDGGPGAALDSRQGAFSPAPPAALPRIRVRAHLAACPQPQGVDPRPRDAFPGARARLRVAPASPRANRLVRGRGGFAPTGREGSRRSGSTVAGPVAPPRMHP